MSENRLSRVRTRRCQEVVTNLCSSLGGGGVDTSLFLFSFSSYFLFFFLLIRLLLKFSQENPNACLFAARG